LKEEGRKRTSKEIICVAKAYHLLFQTRNPPLASELIIKLHSIICPEQTEFRKQDVYSSQSPLLQPSNRTYFSIGIEKF